MNRCEVCGIVNNNPIVVKGSKITSNSKSTIETLYACSDGCLLLLQKTKNLATIEQSLEQTKKIHIKISQCYLNYIQTKQTDKSMDYKKSIKMLRTIIDFLNIMLLYDYTSYKLYKKKHLPIIKSCITHYKNIDIQLKPILDTIELIETIDDALHQFDVIVHKIEMEDVI